jgi:hypothetical protein
MASTPDKTRSAIAMLFAHPPVNQAELELRLSAVDPTGARRMLLRRLREGEISEQEGPLFAAIFDHLGVEEAREPLIRIAGDRAYDALVRAHAMAVIAEESPEEMGALMEHLDPEDLEPLAERSLIELLATIQADPDQADAVVYVLESAPGEMREYMLGHVESCRQKAGTSAAAAYARVLEDANFADLWPQVLEWVVQEGGVEGTTLLERLRDHAASESNHRAFQKSVLRIRTRAIDPQRQLSPPEGTAFVGSCDGQGAYIVLGCFQNPDGSNTVVDLCIRCAADIRDGFVLPRASADELQEIQGEVRRELAIEFVQVPIGEASEMVAAALERTREAGLDVPESARPAVAKFDAPARLAEGGPGPACPPPPSGRLTFKRVREVLQRPEYQDSWFFDMGDLDGAGVSLPTSRSRVNAEWYRRAAARLESDALRRRLVGMARHMCRWHTWRGELELAAVCAGLAAATERDFRSSPLVRVMLEQSLKPVDLGDQEESEICFGDTVLRQHLKALFFQNVNVPKGKDLARLDLTEAALVSLDSIFDSLPGESRPREEERYSSAFTIGKMFADHLLAGADRPMEQLASRMTAALRKTSRLSSAERQRVVLMILPALGGYVEQVCASCTVGCFDRPRSRMADVFFSPGHPVDQQ